MHTNTQPLTSYLAFWALNRFPHKQATKQPCSWFGAKGHSSQLTHWPRRNAASCTHWPQECRKLHTLATQECHKLHTLATQECRKLETHAERVTAANSHIGHTGVPQAGNTCRK